MPLVSVIIPIYNAALYLQQCLDTIISQTLTDIEIICINDGSTDNTPQILEKYKKKDSRIKVLHQSNKGAGVARNLGLEHATGDYLSFLDADDFFDPSLLEEAHKRITEKKADIVIYRIQTYDQNTEKYANAEFAFAREYFTKKDPFSYLDMPDYIFNSFQNWTWNKMFRREFITENNIRFQPLKRTNDLLFTCTALVLAKRITLLDKILAFYRIGTTDNLQSTNHLAPTDFYKAFSSLQDFLKSKGIYPVVKKSFVNWAADGCVSNLESLKAGSSFEVLYNTVKHEALQKLDINGNNHSYFYNIYNIQELNKIRELSCTEFLFNKLNTARAELSYIKKNLGLDIGKQFDKFSYRLGRAITFCPRVISKGIARIKQHGLKYILKLVQIKIN